MREERDGQKHDTASVGNYRVACMQVHAHSTAMPALLNLVHVVQGHAFVWSQNETTDNISLHDVIARMRGECSQLFVTAENQKPHVA